jgi:regulator of protease activity HflC (stomatin/prohibitin superfamily)
MAWSDFSEAIRNLIMTTLRSITGEMDLDQALSSRDKIKVRLRESIADEAVDWGLTVKSVEIQDIKPSASMQKAMELQASAERERKAMVTRAEGEKQSMILQAEARVESARRDAEAQVTLAEASSEAIKRVAQAIGDRDTPMLYLLGGKVHHCDHPPGGIRECQDGRVAGRYPGNDTRRTGQAWKRWRWRPAKAMSGLVSMRA